MKPAPAVNAVRGADAQHHVQPAARVERGVVVHIDQHAAVQHAAAVVVVVQKVGQQLRAAVVGGDERVEPHAARQSGGGRRAGGWVSPVAGRAAAA